jgi:hypothetical protein
MAHRSGRGGYTTTRRTRRVSNLRDVESNKQMTAPTRSIAPPMVCAWGSVSADPTANAAPIVIVNTLIAQRMRAPSRVPVTKATPNSEDHPLPSS